MNQVLPVLVGLRFNLLIALSLSLFVSPNTVQAQCPNDNNFWIAAPSIPCGADATINIGAGTYATFSVVNNATYIFRTCGSTAITGSTFDTQLSGYDNVGNVAFYNDDQGGFCLNCASSACGDAGSTATESYVGWTSTYTGTLQVNVDVFNCNGCTSTDCPSLGSAALRYRQVNNLNFTSSAADMCPGAVRTLSALPLGGTFSGTGVVGNQFTAPATAGVYNITYSLGACQAIQSITVKSASTAPTSIDASPASICRAFGSNTSTLTQIDGVLGTNASWNWYRGSCGGTFLGIGASIVVSPLLGTNNYFVRAIGDCADTTICRSVTVTMIDSTIARAGGRDSACQSPTPLPVTLSGSSVGGSATTGAWSIIAGGGTLNNTAQTARPDTVKYTPAANFSGTVTLRLTSNNPSPCNAATSDKTIVVSPAPTAAPTNNTPICAGNQIDLNANVSGGTPGYNYNWSGPAGFNSGAVSPSISNATTAMSGTYTVVVTDQRNCTGSGTTNVVVRPLPNGNIGGTATLCVDATDTVITLNFSVGTGPFDVTYTDGTSSFVLSGVNSGDTLHVAPATTTTYSYLQITDANGCIRTTGFLGAATITVFPLPVVNSVTATNVLCNGDSTGTITITAASGTPPYNYSIDNGANFQLGNVFIGLSIGSYNVAIADFYGCANSYSLNPVVIGQPTQLAHTDTAVDASCQNVADGRITITASGGTAPYSYSLNGGPSQSGNVFNALTSGTYVVRVADFNGCIDTSHVLVGNVYTVSGGVVSQTSVSCFGGLDGTVTLELVGGVQPYSYSINGVIFQPSPTFTALSSGSYVATLRDSNTCTVFLPVTISQPGQLQAVIDSVKNIACNGDSSGSIYVSANGGTSPYSFLWSNGDTTSSVTGLGAGTYNISITDANGCFTLASTSITEPLPLFLSVASLQNLNCFNDSSGAIDITVNGGVPPYSFAWSNGVTFEDVSGLHPGIYSVTVVDANGCVDSLSQVITEPSQLLSSISANDASCSGSADGSVDFDVTGGTPGYSYFWSNGATTQDLTNVVSGMYAVIATDARGCSITNVVTVGSTGAITLSAVVTDITCSGGAAGAIDLTVSGGTPSYTYNWSNGATTEDLTGIGAGSYTVVVTDSLGCSASLTAFVFQQPAMVLNAFATNVSCYAGSDGAIDLLVQGGAVPFSYLWNTTDTSEDLTGISAGNYAVTVTDAGACSATFAISVAEPPALVLGSVVTPISCNGGLNGAIDMTVQGGTFPYNYVWNTGDSTQDLMSLPAGTYSITVTDAKACSASSTFTLTDPIAITSSINGTNVTCNGTRNGSAVLTVNDGTPPYTLLWNTFQNTATLDSLGGGTYYVIITDANGCEKRDSIVITEPAAIALTASSVNILCNGDSTGSVNLSVSGGTGAYTFAWSNGATTQNLIDLTAVLYSVTVADANLCSTTLSVLITQPAAMVMNATVTNVGCSAGNNGAIDITVQGGVFPYTYSWSNGASTEDISGLSGSTYSVTITDANACSLTASFTLTEPGAITSSVTGTNVTCYGATNGAADLTVGGGTPPYTFLWNTIQNTEDLTAIGGGTYYVIITDANGCEKRDSVVVTEPAPLVLSTQVTAIACHNDTTGAINLTVTGGTPTYTFLWSNGAVTEDIGNLSAGYYDVTVEDANGCIDSASATLLNPSPVSINFTLQHPLCGGDTNGSINLIVSGGTPAYTFVWSNGATTEDVTNLGAGTYGVTVTDAGACTISGLAVLSDPLPFYVSGVVKSVTCFGDSDGAVDITPYGGTPPYLFTWSPTGQSTEDIWNRPGGSDTVLVTDANGCQAVSTYVVNEPAILTANMTSTPLRCFGDNNATVAVVPTGGVSPYQYLWNNFAIDSFLQGVSAGPYVVQLTDSNGCLTFGNAVVTQPQPIVITDSVTHIVCFGAATGAVNVTVTGGSGGYSFLWSSADTTEDISNKAAGTYTLVVTDTLGCTKTVSFTINQGSPVFVSLASVQPTCSGGSTGSITALVNGGVSPYTYSWNTTPPTTTVSVSGLRAGVYAVTVTDARLCTVVASDTLTDSQALSVSTVATGARCFNTLTGSVVTNVNGGTAPLTYLLNGVVQSSGVFNNLAEGNYLVLVTDVNGCQGADSFSVSAPAEIFVSLGATQPVILTGMQTQLVATPTSSSTIVNYYWSPDTVFDFSACIDPAVCPDPMVMPRTTTIFTVVAMNEDSCYATDTITIYVNNDASRFIPTAFTPNNDNLNDRFQFDVLGASNLEVSVYNRWGQRVFYNPNQTNGTLGGNGWDGMLDGKPAPFDTYVYHIIVTYWDNATKELTGTVALMK